MKIKLYIVCIAWLWLCQLATLHLLLENKVDGEAFLLDDAQIKSMHD